MNTIRWTIRHRRYDVQRTVSGPTNKAERNGLREVIRAAERGKLAGRNE